MALELINFLKANGIEVTDFLVVFEPTVKNARSRLQSEGVSLHSIIKT